MLDFCLHSLCFCKLPVQFIIFCNLIFFVFFFSSGQKTAENQPILLLDQRE